MHFRILNRGNLLQDKNTVINRYPSIVASYILIFCVGFSCMVVAGYFLIEGLSQFAGNQGAKRMLIVGGILFQLTESICFISAAALTSHSLRWRYTLFALGMVLFSFSIGVMTLAQKSALQSGESQANAIDEKRDNLRKQIASLDEVISSYRYNAEKQSRSIYKDSRALGQDSINRAAELEDKKYALSDQLFELNQQRKQTSSDFFKRIEEITGLPAKQTEFYFLVLRSLLLEMSGIILMSFGAHLRSFRNINKPDPVAAIPVNSYKPSATNVIPKPILASAPIRAKVIHSGAPTKLRLTSNSTPLIQTDTNIKFSHNQNDADQNDDEPDDERFPVVDDERTSGILETSDTEIQILTNLIVDLYEQKLLTSLSGPAIRAGLSAYCGKKINADKAMLLSKIAKSRQEALF